MKYVFQFKNDMSSIIRKRELRYFELASKKDPSCKIHRNWVDDVIGVFTRKIKILESQAIMVFKTGDFKAVKRFHQNKAKKLPETIWVISEEGKRIKIDNPERSLYESLGNMDISESVRMVSSALEFALSLYHPEDKLPKSFKGEESDEQVSLKMKRFVRHPDESLEAHHSRCAKALEQFYEETNHS